MHNYTAYCTYEILLAQQESHHGFLQARPGFTTLVLRTRLWKYRKGRKAEKKKFIDSMTPRNKLQVVYGRKRIGSLKFFWQPGEFTLSYSRVVGAMIGC